MRVLVTGTGGFIGPHVVSYLEESGHYVRTVDIKPGNHPHHVQADLNDMEAAVSILDGIDCVCHLAGVGDVYLALEQPWTAARENVTVTATLLQACLQAQIRKFVYASTWEVYGEPEYEPVDEAHPCRPTHPYGITKLAGEQLALAYDQLKDLPVLCLRLGTAYGPGMRASSVFSAFISRARCGQPLIIHGDGAQSRQFTHVKDMSRAFALSATSARHGQALNVVSAEKVSIRQLAETIATRFGVALQFEPPRAGEIPPATVSAERCRRLLNWEPQVSFNQGLDELIDWTLRQDKG